MTEEIRYSFDAGIATISVQSSGPDEESDAAVATFAEHMATAMADAAVEAICVTMSVSNADPMSATVSAPALPCDPLLGDKPIVAGLDGFVTGWKLQALLQSDIRIASTRSGFQFFPSGDGDDRSTRLVTWLLPRLVGVSQAFWWLYSGEYLSAREGHELGLICSLVPDSEIWDVTRRMARAASNDGASERAKIRSLLYAGLDRSLSAHVTEGS